MYNIERIHNDFPVLHKMLFFATAGVGPLPRATIVAMQHYLKELRVDFSKNAWEKDPRDEARTLAAQLIHASQDEVVLTDSTSAGINLLAGALPWKRGENIVLNDLEYPANVFPWLYQADRHGLEVRMIHSRDGVVPLEKLINAIDKKTRVLAISHVEFGTGYRNDIATLAEAVHKVNGLICVDAIQSLGVLQVDVRNLGIDMLATGGYKWLCGPLGTGFAFIKSELMDRLHPPTLTYANLPKEEEETVWNALISGADYPMKHAPLADGRKRFEAQGLSPVLFKGFAISLRYLLDLEMDSIESRIAELVDYLILALNQAGIAILSPTGSKERSGIVTVRVPFDLTQSEEIKALEEKLHKARIIALPRSGGLRLAVHFFNMKEEIDQVVNFIKRL
ncbi:aminotransferase class V-fold PLP-dependent enzyme [Candidatus Bipolaricaulota bacterium]|nr:aminotransferase class V-fold PLP-dependent enzyme [Candidatus Bipolaricaulota bacterium]